MTAVTGARPELDLQDRRAAVRRKEILLKVEQWGPGYRSDADDWTAEVGEFVDATDEELTWLRQYVAANGRPQDVDRSTEQWSQLRREQGRQANAASGAAFLAGAYDAARDLIDDARAYGALMETEWVRLHTFIVAKAAENAPVAKPAVPAQRAA
ncbi:hypothetical protein ACWKSP_04065 [Micromonosporaceae bacterium Da 78-11]